MCIYAEKSSKYVTNEYTQNSNILSTTVYTLIYIPSIL